MKPQSSGIKALRYLFGAIILVFGFNGFLQFLPMPHPPEPAGAFLGALGKTGYMLPLLYGIEVVMGLLLLINRFVPLVLLAFVPIAVNILFYHLFLDPAGGVVGYLTFLIELILLYAYRDYYKMLFQPTIS